MAKRETQQRWDDYQDRMKKKQAEIDNVKAVYPMAIKTYDESEVVDYTGSFTGYDPTNDATN